MRRGPRAWSLEPPDPPRRNSCEVLIIRILLVSPTPPKKRKLPAVASRGCGAKDGRWFKVDSFPGVLRAPSQLSEEVLTVSWDMILITPTLQVRN